MTDELKGYVISLDIGTTKIKCQILNSTLQVKSYEFLNVRLHYPQPGYVEIKPEELWEDILTVIKKAISNANINFSEVLSIGISTQRATFITWRKSDKKPLHNFITWKDIRTKQFVKNINTYWNIRLIKSVAYILHIFTRSTKFFVGSRLKFASTHTSVRLLWAILNIPKLQEALSEDDVMFATLETWLLYRLTNYQTYVTEISNASATGLYDPFILDWGITCNLLNIPKKILPPVVGNDYDFGTIHQSIFGYPIKIGCVLSDTCSSMLGAGCLQKNSLKVTLGTGAFLNVNTGNTIYGSSGGMYPIVLWKFGNDVTYSSEVSCNDSGSLIEWALSADFIKTPSESFDLVNNTTDNGGVYYIAAFSGLGPPINNENAASGFIGIKPTTRKAHMVRAILESIVFRVALTINHLMKDRPSSYVNLRVDGGVASNNFICQMLADITGLKIERLKSNDLSLVGVGFLAGISAGIWKNMNALENYMTVEETFTPSGMESRIKIQAEMSKWMEAAERFKSWNTDDDSNN